MSRYEKSELHLVRAEKTIPLGSQTFSKSRTQYPVGISPLYIDRAKGCRVWDLDDNEYIDLVSSLASITVGYGNKEISSAIKKQLKKGVTFSLPGILETQVAELICELVPSAEMVRFGKNGTDATSAAVRLARAYTGREHIIVCGYHGWQDWYIGSTTRNKGVPASVSQLTHTFPYNDLSALVNLFQQIPDIACVVMEPMNNEYPNPGFLEGVQELTRKYGAVLIFDETITGFRFSKGGAQELFGVTPDLSTFGKGIANGFPLSAVVGKREIMMEMEEIFYSGTFGGELLSLAAAKKVLEMHYKNQISEALLQKGKFLSDQVESVIENYGLSDALALSGHPTWRFLNWKGTSEYTVEQIRTYFSQEMYRRGVLILNTHNISLAHTQRDLTEIIAKYDETLEGMSKALSSRSLKEKLLVEPLKPLFRVR